MLIKRSKLLFVKKTEKENREKHRQSKPLKRKKAKYPYSDFYFYYKRSKDGRIRLHLINPDTKEVRFKLLARYRIEVKLKRFLTKDETVDHIDEDRTNDKLSNLQVIPMRSNIIKSALHRNPDLYNKHCVICGGKMLHTARGKTCSMKCKMLYRKNKNWS